MYDQIIREQTIFSVQSIDLWNIQRQVGNRPIREQSSMVWTVILIIWIVAIVVSNGYTKTLNI